MAYSGKFSPKNPGKYKGDPTNIVYRSLWERNVMDKLDTWDDVAEWSSEEMCLPYRCPTDEKIHRYFPDMIIRLKSGKTIMIEIKPKARCKEPKKPKKVTKRFIGEVLEYGKNQAKWAAARAYCADRGWEFQIITEDDIFGTKAK